MAKLSIVVDFVSSKFTAGIANIKRSVNDLGSHVTKSFGKGIFGKLLGFGAVVGFFKNIASEATKAFEAGDFSVYSEKTATALAQASKNVEGFWATFKSKAGDALAWAASKWMSFSGTLGALSAGSTWDEARKIGKAEGAGTDLSAEQKAKRDQEFRDRAIDRAVSAAQKRQDDERIAGEKKYAERLKAQVQMWKNIARERNDREKEWHRISADGYEQMMDAQEKYEEKLKDTAATAKRLSQEEAEGYISKLRTKAEKLANIAMPQGMSPLQEMAEKAGKKLLRGGKLSRKEIAAVESVSLSRRAAEQESANIARIAKNTDFLRDSVSLGN